MVYQFRAAIGVANTKERWVGSLSWLCSLNRLWTGRYKEQRAIAWRQASGTSKFFAIVGLSIFHFSSSGWNFGH